MQTQTRFDKRHQPARRASVADIGLGAAQMTRQRALRMIEKRRQRGRFECVFALIAATVRLYQLHSGGRKPRFRVGLRQGLRVSIVTIGRAHAANHRIHAVAIPLGIGQALEHHAGRALARHRAIGGGVERARTAFTRISAHRIGGEQAAQVAIEIHRTRERGVKLTALQRAHRDIERTQPRSVFTANRVARPADMKLARDPARDNAAECAQGAVCRQRQACTGTHLLGPLLRLGAIGREAGFARPHGSALLHAPAEMKIGGAQVEAQADEHAAARRVECGAASIVKRCLGDIEHQQLLRQHLRHFARRNVKTVQRHCEIIDVIARKSAPRAILLMYPGCANIGGTHTAPGCAGHGWVLRIAVEHALRERSQISPMPHMHAHADDGDWRGCLGNIDCGHRSASVRFAAEGAGSGRCIPQPLLNQQVRIDATKPKTIDRRATWHLCATPLPRLALLQYVERTVRQAHLVRGPFKIGHRRQRAVLHRQQCFDEARAACCSEQMADVRLDGAQHALASAPITALPQPRQAGELHRIAHRRAGGVALNQVHHVGRPARLRIGRMQGAQLALGAGRKQIAFGVVRQTGTANQAEDLVAIGERICQALQHHHARAFTHDQAIAFDIERRAAPARRERAQLRKTHLGVERIGARQATGQHRAGTMREQFVAGEFDSVER